EAISSRRAIMARDCFASPAMTIEEAFGMPLSNKEKMLAGEGYFANDPELVAERRRAQQVLAQYNARAPGDQATRPTLLRQLFGAIGEGADILPRFHCDYGYTIRI